MGSRDTFVIGDLHGTLEEAKELLDKIKYDPAKVRLIFLGDLIHRGEHSKGCVDLVRSLKAECVRANHEDKVIRYYKHEQARKKSGTPNPMNPSKHHLEIYNSLDTDDILWMDSLPLMIELKKNAYALHAGIEPGRSFDKQDPAQVIRVRYVDKDGMAVALNKDKSQPKGTEYWADVWNGNISFVYGHNAKDKIVITENKNNTCYGIDSGCVYGHYLTGMFWERKEFVQVKARKVYWKR